MLNIRIVLFVLVFLAAAPFPTSADSLRGEHIREGSLGLYTIYLKESEVAKGDVRNEAPARSTRDLRNQTDVYGWHRPQARKMVRALEAEYGLKTVTMTSHILPSMSAFMPDGLVEDLLRDPRVLRVVPARSIAKDLSGWQNTTAGGETLPWGLAAVGADDQNFSGSGNYLYMIDGIALIDGTSSAHQDLNIELAPVNNPSTANRSAVTAAPGHANHVAGILGAKISSSGVRGVAPGIRVIAVYRGESTATMNTAIEWVTEDAVIHGIYGVANISSSGVNWIVSQSDFGGHWPFVNAARDRVLVQAAGNSGGQACFEAFGPPSQNDGVLVVGGIDESGRQAALYNNNGTGYGNGASNYGDCVEVWAPSTNIISTWNTSANQIQVLSGTSMAAPYVAGIAARYGSNSTFPAQREAYVRSLLKPTGHFDGLGIPIMVPSITTPKADLSLTTAALTSAGYPGPSELHKDVVFELAVTNEAGMRSDSATAYAYVDALASDVTWRSPACSVVTATPAPALYACATGMLATGETKKFRLVLRRTSGSSTYINAGLGSQHWVDPNGTNNAASNFVVLNAPPAGTPISRYRLYNHALAYHLYTTDYNEYQALNAYPWQQEGTIGRLLNNPGSFNGAIGTPYYRMYNTTSHLHFWTTDINEYYTLDQDPNWTGEGVDGYLLQTAAAGTTPLYRLFHTGSPYGRHLWTIDLNEFNTLVGIGWQSEGVPGHMIQ